MRCAGNVEAVHEQLASGSPSTWRAHPGLLTGLKPVGAPSGTTLEVSSEGLCVGLVHLVEDAGWLAVADGVAQPDPSTGERVGF